MIFVIDVDVVAQCWSLFVFPSSDDAAAAAVAVAVAVVVVVTG